MYFTIPVHSLYQFLGALKQYSTIRTYQFVASSRIHIIDASWKSETVAVITFCYFCRDKWSPFICWFDNNGCVTDTCYDTVSFDEVLLVGICTTHKFGKQSSALCHFGRCTPMYRRINSVQTMSQNTYCFHFMLQGCTMSMYINPISQSTDNYYIW